MGKHGGYSWVEGIVLEAGRKTVVLSQARERCRSNNVILTVIFPAVLVVAKTPKSEIITLDAKSDHMMRGH